MAPSKSSDGDGGDEEAPPTHTLWVGNLFPETTDADLMGVFGKFGALDCNTNYSGRSFAFVYFKDPADAMAAKDALQGHVLLGNPIKIEFSRPSKPGKSVWIGAIGLNVTKEQLEDEFKKFGKIEELRFFRDRNTAIVNYYKLDDAVVAVKNMNGKQLDGELIRVDYLRSQPSRRDNWSDYRDLRDGQVNNKRGPVSDAAWRQSSVGGRRGQPSNILWIGYPLSVQMDEQMLHNAMILFGEIERIKSFPSRHYAFVEFRSVDEARRAKEGLQGRLFNDPRIHIMFSSSDFAPGKDDSSFYPGIRGSRPDMHFNEQSFGPGSVDLVGHPRQMGPSNFHGPSPPNAIPGPYTRPFGPRSFEPQYSGPDSYNDFSGPLGSNWRSLSSPPSGMLPASGMRPSVRPVWDGYETNSFQREPKRSRLDGPSTDSNAQVPIHDSPLIGRGHSLDRPYGDQQSLPEIDYCWRGVIAKGGSPVCHARCVSVGKGIDSQLPDVVNCSAKTGLDMLTKHYAEATGFDIVYFLPDCEDDFASYTEFLRYLGSRNRAGVAKLDDGTTFFLVPPSDFLSKVLNVSGPERLYGVVLKLPSTQPQRLVSPTLNSEYRVRPPVSTQHDYSLGAQKEDHGLQVNYGRILHDESTHIGSSKPLLASADESRALLPRTTDYGGSAPAGQSSAPAGQSQPGVGLTPELLATLAALVPSNAQPAVTSAQIALASSVRPPLPSYPAAAGPEKVVQTHGWRQDDQSSLVSQQQLGHQYNQSSILSQMPTYSSVVSAAELPAQAILNGGTQLYDAARNLQLTGPNSSASLNNAGPTQGVQMSAPQATQQYPLDMFRPPLPQQPMPSVTPGALQGAVTSQPHFGVYDNSNAELPNRVLQLQPSVSASGQGQPDNEADKNQRYQSTLQFAASLLMQIQQQQQQQQQANAQGMQGPNNQQ